MFIDRICDGHRDCPNGEDEDGTLGQCHTDEEKTAKSCCMNIIANHKYANQCKPIGTLNGKDAYDCVVFKVCVPEVKAFFLKIPRTKSFRNVNLYNTGLCGSRL